MKVAVKISDYLDDDERLLQVGSIHKQFVFIVKFADDNKFQNESWIETLEYCKNIVEASGCYIDLCKKKIYLIKELVEGHDLMGLLCEVGRFEGKYLT